MHLLQSYDSDDEETGSFLFESSTLDLERTACFAHARLVVACSGASGSVLGHKRSASTLCASSRDACSCSP
jgi:hypothetical protein